MRVINGPLGEAYEEPPVDLQKIALGVIASCVQSPVELSEADQARAVATEAAGRCGVDLTDLALLEAALWGATLYTRFLPAPGSTVTIDDIGEALIRAGIAISSHFVEVTRG
jgi:hypothetical protein